jgi:sarcosine oxidase subunit alpha
VHRQLADLPPALTVAARRRPPADGPGRRTVRFLLDGRPVEGLEGESVAVSLLAAGHTTLSRSFRFHRPRGLMCDTGRCGWCACRIDGRPSVHACQTPVRDGLRVESEHAWPSVSRDVLSLLGLGARFVAPTFYHHRFLRPRRLRRTYLDVLRALGGRGRLAIGAERSAAMDARPVRRLERHATDVLVVGGGEAGLLAAGAAAEAGASVIVVDERPSTGIEPMPGVAVWSGTVAIGWYDGVVTALDAERQVEIRAGAVVVASGTLEDVPRVPGADRPGVMAARLVGRLLDLDVVPGERVLLVSDQAADPGLGALAGRLVASGVTVLGPVASDSLVAIHGRDHVRSVTLATTDGRRRRERVDIVAFAGRRPSLDLPLAVGATLRWEAGALVPVLDESGRTSAAQVFVVGGGAGRSVDDEAGRASARETGASAGRAAIHVRGSDVRGTTGRGAEDPMASAITGDGRPGDGRPGDPPRPQQLAPVTAPRTDGSGGDALGPVLAPGTIACFCEDVHVREIEHECATGYTDPELVKRRTGALTGPCQGAYCRSVVSCVITRATSTPGVLPLTARRPAPLPTARPPLRPVRLVDLAVESAAAELEGRGDARDANGPDEEDGRQPYPAGVPGR